MARTAESEALTAVRGELRALSTRVSAPHFLFAIWTRRACVGVSAAFARWYHVVPLTQALDTAHTVARAAARSRRRLNGAKAQVLGGLLLQKRGVPERTRLALCFGQWVLARLGAPAAPEALAGTEAPSDPEMT